LKRTSGSSRYRMWGLDEIFDHRLVQDGVEEVDNIP
jgi:hypothetical protein